MIASAPLRGPPVVPGLPLLGALSMLGPDMHRRIAARHEQLGDVYLFRLGATRVWSVRDPGAIGDVLVRQRDIWVKTGSQNYDVLSELIGRGLLTSDGPSWLRQRRLSTPAFHKERVAGFIDDMVALADDVVARLADAADRGVVVDLAREMLRYTQEVIAVTLLSLDLRSGRGRRLADALDAGLRAVETRTNSAVRLPLSVPTKNNRALRAARATLDAIIAEVLAERRAARARGAVAGGDLLDMLMDTVDEDRGDVLSDADLHDEILTLFLAGHETTSNLLSWTLLALSENPALADALAASLSSTTPAQAARPSSSTLLDRVVDEALRWRPPVWAVERIARSETTLAGFAVREHDRVLVSAWALHHDHKHWPAPDRFDPDRFLPDVVDARPKLAYLPFLAGNRKCLGDVFALAEAKIVLAALAPRFRFVLTAQPVEDLAITLGPREGRAGSGGGVLARVERR